MFLGRFLAGLVVGFPLLTHKLFTCSRDQRMDSPVNILSCYSKILQKNGFQSTTWFSEEKPGFQEAYGKYGFCTAFIRILYGFCTGFRKHDQVLQPKTRFSTRNRCKTCFLLPTFFFVGSSSTRLGCSSHDSKLLKVLWKPRF